MEVLFIVFAVTTSFLFFQLVSAVKQRETSVSEMIRVISEIFETHSKSSKETIDKLIMGILSKNLSEYENAKLNEIYAEKDKKEAEKEIAERIREEFSDSIIKRASKKKEETLEEKLNDFKEIISQ